MAGKTSTVLKGYFKAGLKPLQEHFEALVDTLYEKAASVLPQDDNSFNLGSSTKNWKSLFVSQDINSRVTISALFHHKISRRNNVENGLIRIDLSEGNVQVAEIGEDCEMSFVNSSVGIYKVVVKLNVDRPSFRFSPGIYVSGNLVLDQGATNVLTIVVTEDDLYVDIKNMYAEVL